MESAKPLFADNYFYAWPQSGDDLETALRLTERHCVAPETIRSSPATTLSYRTRGEEG